MTMTADKKSIAIAIGAIIFAGVIGMIIGGFNGYKNSEVEWNAGKRAQMIEEVSGEIAYSLPMCSEEYIKACENDPDWLSPRKRICKKALAHGYRVVDVSSDAGVKFAKEIANGMLGESTVAPKSAEYIMAWLKKEGYELKKVN